MLAQWQKRVSATFSRVGTGVSQILFGSPRTQHVQPTPVPSILPTLPSLAVSKSYQSLQLQTQARTNFEAALKRRHSQPSFSESAKEAYSLIHRECRLHPFVKDLRLGTLNSKALSAHIAQQEALFESIAGCYTVIASETRNDPVSYPPILPDHYAYDPGIEAQRKTHQDLIEQWKLETPQPLSTSTMRYREFLSQLSTQAPSGTIVAAMLAHFGISQEVYRLIDQHTGPNHPYALWFASFRTPEYQANLEELVEIADLAALHGTEEQQRNMLNTFRSSLWYEYHAMDAAYRGKTHDIEHPSSSHRTKP